MTHRPAEFPSQVSEILNRYQLLAPVMRANFIPYLPEYDAGVDFILYRESDDLMLKVQLKSRWSVDKKYLSRNLWIAFPCQQEGSVEWYLVPHDLMVRHGYASHGHTESWTKGIYHKPALGVEWRSFYADFEISTLLETLTPNLASGLLRDVAGAWS